MVASSPQRPTRSPTRRRPSPSPRKPPRASPTRAKASPAKRRLGSDVTAALAAAAPPSSRLRDSPGRRARATAADIEPKPSAAAEAAAPAPVGPKGSRVVVVGLLLLLLAFVVQYADLAGAGPLRPEPPTVQPTPQPRLLRRVQSFLKNHVPQKRSPT
mmetsp:Transcript_22575/g.64199  ORF Transcript_22575/g.64199 Transcript_22575/m.64199 type:complete len:158 (-) Transcript_22575:441-914(-)